MKKKLAIPSFVSLISMSLVGIIAGSLAWLSDKADIKTNSKVGGSSEGAYFAYGDGSEFDDPATPVKEGPYGIETARQLYNLAWLQYLGRFNKAKNGVIEPKYFELNADIDMTGWVIPPIGTSKYPFIGSFSGKAIVDYDQQGKPIYSAPHTITNLQTTNDYDQILASNKVPGRIKRDGKANFTDVNIIGMFGVVGELANNIPDTYDTSVTSISDFNLVKATITSTTSNTLGGIVAGYVNGPISGVVVDGENVVGKMNASMLNLSKGTANYSFNDGQGHAKAFTNISDYGLIGYAENTYLENVHTNTVETYNAVQREYDYIAQDPDDYQGWGGSIPMTDIYTNLQSYKSSARSAGGIPYPTKRTINKNEAGAITYDQYDQNSYTTTNDMDGKEVLDGYTNPGTGDAYNYYNYEQKNASNEVTSSYGFVYDSATDDRFVCLTGEKTVLVKDACTTTTNYYEDIVDSVELVISYKTGGTTHYLKNNGTTGVTDTTTEGSASTWVIENKYLSTTINSTKYYLNINNNSNLVLSTTATTLWDYNESTGQIYSYTGGANGYQLRYQSGWGVVSTSLNYCLFTDGYGNYLSYNNSYTPSNSTNAASATRWTYSTTYSAYGISSGFDTNYMIYYSNSYKFIIYSRYYASGYYAYNGRYLSYSGNYVVYDGSWTTSTTPTEIIAVPTFSTTYSMIVDSKENTHKELVSKVTRENSPMQLKPTFFPLKETNGVPEETNTGYVVSGGNYKVDQYGDIRFGRFAKNTYLPNTLNTIYTIESDGTTTANSIDINSSRIVSDTERNNVYTKSKAKMQEIISGANNIDGLHFVDAPMDISKTVIVPKAVINSVPYTNYQVPQDCIDFNLKEKGYINFFAGSYFKNNTSGTNNSFFTLHEIQRVENPSNPDNPHPITAINEIVAIYSDGNDGHSYVYEYAKADGSGNKYSKPFMFKTVNNQSVKYELNGTTLYQNYSRESSLHSGYNSTPIFKSSWIGINTLRSGTSGRTFYGYAYYFDIAMNDGEYALGSVPNGGVGAYLMYLDIGANAQKKFRSEIIEYFKMIDELYVHPKGITLTIISAGLSSNDKNAYCISIKNSYTGTLTMEKVRNGDVEEGRYVGTGDASKEAVSYKLPSDVLKDENGDKKTCTAQSTTTTEIKRMTFYDYSVITNSLEKIVIEDKYINGSLSSRTVKKYKSWDISTNTGTEDANMDLYIVTGSGSSQVSHNYKDKTDQITFSTSSNTTKLMVFTVVFPDGGVVNVTFTLSVTSRQEAEHYWYSPSTYDVTVTLTKATGVTEDITALVYITYVKNTDGTYTYTLKFNGQTATITTTPIEITTGS